MGSWVAENDILYALQSRKRPSKRKVVSLNFNKRMTIAFLDYRLPVLVNIRGVNRFTRVANWVWVASRRLTKVSLSHMEHREKNLSFWVRAPVLFHMELMAVFGRFVASSLLTLSTLSCRFGSSSCSRSSPKRDDVFAFLVSVRGWVTQAICVERLMYARSRRG